MDNPTPQSVTEEFVNGTEDLDGALTRALAVGFEAPPRNALLPGQTHRLVAPGLPTVSFTISETGGAVEGATVLP